MHLYAMLFGHESAFAHLQPRKVLRHHIRYGSSTADACAYPTFIVGLSLQNVNVFAPILQLSQYLFAFNALSMAPSLCSGSQLLSLSAVTTHWNHAKEIAQEAERRSCDGIICVSGDGSAVEVRNLTL